MADPIIRKSVKLQFMASKDFDKEALKAAIKKQDSTVDVDKIVFWKDEYYEDAVDSLGGKQTHKLDENLVNPPPPAPEEPE